MTREELYQAFEEKNKTAEMGGGTERTDRKTAPIG